MALSAASVSLIFATASSLKSLKGARQGPTGLPVRLVAFLVTVLGLPNLKQARISAMLAWAASAPAISPAMNF